MPKYLLNALICRTVLLVSINTSKLLHAEHFVCSGLVYEPKIQHRQLCRISLIGLWFEKFCSFSKIFALKANLIRDSSICNLQWKCNST